MQLSSHRGHGNRPDVVLALVLIQVNDLPSILAPHRPVAAAGDLGPLQSRPRERLDVNCLAAPAGLVHNPVAIRRERGVAQNFSFTPSRRAEKTPVSMAPRLNSSVLPSRDTSSGRCNPAGVARSETAPPPIGRSTSRGPPGPGIASRNLDPSGSQSVFIDPCSNGCWPGWPGSSSQALLKYASRRVSRRARA